VATLREVVTRFKFETDEQSVKKINRRVNTMKRGIAGIGKILGIGLGVAGAKAAFSLGQSFARSRQILRDLVGVEFTPLENSMNRIKADLEIIKTGAKDIFTPREFNVAAAGFFRVFETSRENLKLFDQIFRSAAKQSGVTGENVVSIVEQLTNAVQSGDFSALLKLPDVTQSDIKRLEDINALFDIGEIGGQAIINRRREELSRILSEQADNQTRSLGAVESKLITTDAAAKKLKATMEKTTDTITDVLVPGVDKAVRGIGDFIDGLKEIPDNTKTFFGVDQQDPQVREQELKRRFEQQERTKNTTQRNNVNITNNININGANDPKAVAKETDKVMRNTIKNARENIIPTEDR